MVSLLDNRFTRNVGLPLALIAGSLMVPGLVSEAGAQVTESTHVESDLATGVVTANGTLASAVSFDYPANVSIAADELIEDQLYTFTFDVQNTSDDPMEFTASLDGNPNMIWGVRRVDIVQDNFQDVPPGGTVTFEVTLRTNDDLRNPATVNHDISFDILLSGTRDVGPVQTTISNGLAGL
jgi:hypothetical protein